MPIMKEWQSQTFFTFKFLPPILFSYSTTIYVRRYCTPQLCVLFRSMNEIHEIPMGWGWNMYNLMVIFLEILLRESSNWPVWEVRLYASLCVLCSLTCQWVRSVEQVWDQLRPGSVQCQWVGGVEVIGALASLPGPHLKTEIGFWFGVERPPPVPLIWTNGSHYLLLSNRLAPVP